MGCALTLSPVFENWRALAFREDCLLLKYYLFTCLFEESENCLHNLITQTPQYSICGRSVWEALFVLQSLQASFKCLTVSDMRGCEQEKVDLSCFELGGFRSLLMSQSEEDSQFWNYWFSLVMVRPKTSQWRKAWIQADFSLQNSSDVGGWSKFLAHKFWVSYLQKVMPLRFLTPSWCTHRQWKLLGSFPSLCHTLTLRACWPKSVQVIQ